MIINHSWQSWNGLSSKVPNGMQNISCMDSVVICDTKQMTLLLNMSISDGGKSAPSSGYCMTVNWAETNQMVSQPWKPSVKCKCSAFHYGSSKFISKSHTCPKRQKQQQSSGTCTVGNFMKKALSKESDPHFQLLSFTPVVAFHLLNVIG